MDNKLYVGGLPYSVTEQRLREIFSACGTVKFARVISDKWTGRSRGFGFVEMGSAAEAQSAIQALHGSVLEGRTLVVDEARPRRPFVGEAQKRFGERQGMGVKSEKQVADSPGKRPILKEDPPSCLAGKTR
ncbi:MAG TPA: RNA-binding protein [Candidatus Acidoferrales bacterium]|nr:RNA-binding protein [Candidatus Acidoferrales bacterium]